MISGLLRLQTTVRFLLLAFLLVVLLLLRSPHPQGFAGISQARAALFEALGPVRPLKGRLVGFGYLPLEVHVDVMEGILFNGGERPPQLDNLQVRNAAPVARRIVHDYERLRTARTLGDRALVLLLRQEFESFEQARSLLEEAVTADPRNAVLWSDLAASYLAPSRFTPRNNFLALWAADRAIQENPALLEAHFNLALALEECALFHQARRAWLSYLLLDAASGWADEAREHLQRLRQPNPRRQWNHIWKPRLRSGKSVRLSFLLNQIAQQDTLEDILGHWAALRSEGKEAEAELELENARKISNILSQKGYDKTLKDEVDAITAARGDVLALFEKGHQAYQVGMINFRQRRLDIARTQIALASRLFAEAQSPLEHWANFTLAEIDSLNSEFQSMEDRIKTIRANANLTRYSSLNQHLFFLEGISYLSRSDFAAARTAFSVLSRSSAMRSDAELRAAADFYSTKSDPLNPEEIGNGPRYGTLVNLPKFPESRAFYDFLIDMADRFAESQPRNSLYLLDEGIECARKVADPTVTIELLIDRGRLEGRLGKIDESRRDLSVAHQQISALGDRTAKTKLEVEEEVTGCQIHAVPNNLNCVALVTQAITHYPNRDSSWLARAYTTRAEYFHELGDIASEELDLSKAVNLYESISTSSYSSIWSLRFGSAKDVFKSMIDLLATRGDSYHSLEFEERSRRMTLPTRIFNAPKPHGAVSMSFSGNSSPYSAKEFLDRLPSRMILVDYEFNGGHLDAWIFRGAECRRLRLRVTRNETRAHLHSPQGTSYGVNPHIASTELSEWLLQPVISWLPPEGDIFFVVDPTLDSVNFSALKNSITGRPLSRDYGVGIIDVAPGFSLYGDLNQAVAFARSHVATNLFSPQASQPGRTSHSIPEMLEALPRHTVVLEYSILDDRLLIWIASHHNLQLRVAAIGRRRLEELTNRWLGNTLYSGLESTPDQSDSLYGMLINPALDLLPASGDLVIVPDGILARVPFAALRNSDGKFLLETYSISISTSIGLYLEQLKRIQYMPCDKWSVLLIRGTLLSGSTQSEFLAGADEEVARVLQLFPGSAAMPGRSQDRFRAYHHKHEIVQFSGHWSPSSPTYGESWAADRLPLNESVQLVVLSACSTAINTPWRRGIGFGLAGPLLASGIPSVIASLWNVDDLATSRLLVNFYTHFRSGTNAAESLRAAQLDLLRGKDAESRAPVHWASFQLFGFGRI